MRKFLVLLAAAASFAAFQVGVAHAAPCGVVAANTTLAANCDAPLIVAASGITVDLNGHSVVCNLPVNGIVLPASVSSVVVRNGSVTNGTSNCVNGVEVDGNSNRVSRISSHHNTDAGFIVFGSHNSIENSTAAFNDDDGISFFVGSDNQVLLSTAVGNGDKGIISGSSRTLILANRVSDNARGIYLSDNSTGQLVLANNVHSNIVGIEINATASSNRVVANTSLSNTLDLSDDNPNCDSNFWAFNTFGTRNQSCIH